MCQPSMAIYTGQHTNISIYRVKLFTLLNLQACPYIILPQNSIPCIELKLRYFQEHEDIIQVANMQNVFKVYMWSCWELAFSTGEKTRAWTSSWEGSWSEQGCYHYIGGGGGGDMVATSMSPPCTCFWNWKRTVIYIYIIICIYVHLLL